LISYPLLVLAEILHPVGWARVPPDESEVAPPVTATHEVDLRARPMLGETPLVRLETEDGQPLGGAYLPERPPGLVPDVGSLSPAQLRALIHARLPPIPPRQTPSVLARGLHHPVRRADDPVRLVRRHRPGRLNPLEPPHTPGLLCGPFVRGRDPADTVCGCRG